MKSCIIRIVNYNPNSKQHMLEVQSNEKPRRMDCINSYNHICYANNIHAKVIQEK